jgi:hypothetical protein
MATIDVTIVDSTGGTKRNAGLPNNILLGRLTAALVKKMGLPIYEPDGCQVQYHLTLEKEGVSIRLNEDATLEQVGVQSGDTLGISAEMAAGKGVEEKIAIQIRDIEKVSKSFFKADKWNGELARRSNLSHSISVKTVEDNEGAEETDEIILQLIHQLKNKYQKSEAFVLNMMKEATTKSISKGIKKRQASQLKGFTCFKNGEICPLNIQTDDRTVLIAAPPVEEQARFYNDVICPTLTKFGYRCNTVSRLEMKTGIICKICELVQRSVLLLVDITDWKPDTLFVLGMMCGMGKKAILIKPKSCIVPIAIQGLEYIEYDNFDMLKNDLVRMFVKITEPSHSFTGKACAYCHREFSDDDKIVVCMADRIPHHKECWEKKKACIICKNSTYLSFK